MRVPILTHANVSGEDFDGSDVANAIGDVLDEIVLDAIAAGCPESQLRERFEEAIERAPERAV